MNTPPAAAPAEASFLEAHWRCPKPWLTALLWPLSRLFQGASAVRRALYRVGILRREAVGVPVVVVGNLHAGGVGKTPLVLALAQSLNARGIAVGIISRGYGRKNQETLMVNPHGSAADFGDEPLLLARLSGVPVAVGAKRVEAARLLLARHPETRLLLADDGLQHYALAADCRVAVWPAADVGRRLDVLPNGPLREPMRRLVQADAVVVNAGFQGALAAQEAAARLMDEWPGTAAGLTLRTVPVLAAHLESGRLYRLNAPQQYVEARDFVGKKLTALCAIARPERFFATLAALGIEVERCVVLPDHAPLQAQDLPEDTAVVITEKDAVKLSGSLNRDDVWVLPVCAIIQPDLADFVRDFLKLSA